MSALSHRPTTVLAIAAAVLFGLAGGVCSAQTPAAAAKPPTKPPAKPAAKPAPKPARKAAAATPAGAVLPAADAEQLAAADIAYLGDYACEFKQRVTVSRHATHAGYLDVQHGKTTYTMKPVLSSTGALRLEDVRGRMLMLQIANKSMLMDIRLGQRVVDDCVHEKHREFANQPPGEGLGIAAPAAAASAPR